MAQTKIIIDTNAYLRLGKSISPLLGRPFGKEKFTLQGHDYLNKELERNDRFENKFPWINDEICVKEKKKIIPKSSEAYKSISETYDHIFEYEKAEKLSLSLEDKYCLGTALELELTCVTDEYAMRNVAKEFDINVLTTIGLIKLMVENNFLEICQAKDIINYLEYKNDLPYSKEKVKQEFKLSFNEEL